VTFKPKTAANAMPFFPQWPVKNADKCDCDAKLA